MQEKTFFDAYEDLCTRSWFLVTIITENESYNIALNFLKDPEWNFKPEIKIYNNFIFLVEKLSIFYNIFNQKMKLL